MTEQARQQAELLRRKNRELDEINQKMNVLYRELEIRNRELQSERDFTNTIVDTVASLIMVQNRQGQIVRFNGACEETSGYSSDEVKGLYPWSMFLGAEAEQIAIADFDQLLTGTPSIQKETDWITRDGSHRTIGWSRTPLKRSDGTVEYIISTGVDITDRKHAEEERVQHIREQAARSEAEASARRTAFLADASSVLGSSMDYEETFSTIPGLAIPVLADLCLACVLESESSTCRIEVAQNDLNKEELIRQLCEHPLDFGRMKNPLIEAMSTRESILLRNISDSEVERLAENPKHCSLLKQLNLKSGLIVPLQSRGRVMGVMASFRAQLNRHYEPNDLDMAEDLGRRAALALDNCRLYLESQNANQAKDEFLAMVSHELRTPLNSILGWAKMLQCGKLDPTYIQKGLETIERNAKAQVQLIEDLLDVSRIIVGKLRLNICAVEMAPVLEAALDAIRPMAELKGIQIESKIDATAGVISGDPDRLQQVFWNLLSNAIKFTPENGRVKVTLQRTNSHVQVITSDTGKGMSSEFLPYVFERFRQGNTGLARSHGLENLIERIAKFRAEQLTVRDKRKGKKGREGQLERVRQICATMPSVANCSTKSASVSRSEAPRQRSIAAVSRCRRR
jgi:PAS domain S-box-containing protein